MKRTLLPILCVLFGLHSSALGQADPIVDPSVDAILDQIQQEINSSAELQNLRSRITATGESPSLVPDPNAPRPAPQPQPQRRVMVPASAPVPAAPDPTDAILAEIQQEISQNSEVAALRNRLSNIPSFGPDFAEPSPPPPGSEPPAPAPQPQRLPQQTAPVGPPREAPTTYNTVDESSQLPAVLPMPESYALPNSNVPQPPVFESAPDTPPRRPEAPLELPSWSEPEATPAIQSGSAMPEPQPEANQSPFGSPRGQEMPPESADRGKQGFFSRVFGRKDEANVQAQAATALTPTVDTPVQPTPPAPTPVPQPPAPMPQPEPVKVSENATEIASMGNEPKPAPTLLPSARIPASEARDPQVNMDDASVPPLLKPLKLDWLKGSESQGNAVDEP